MPGEVTLAHQVGKDFMPVTGGSQLAYVLLETRPTEMMAQVRMPLAVVLQDRAAQARQTSGAPAAPGLPRPTS